MIHIQRYSSANKGLWNQFLTTAKNGIFMFNRDFMEYHSDRFTDHSLLFYNDSDLIALLPANEKEHVLYSHQGLTFGGFITNQDMKQHHMLDCFATLHQYLIQQKFTACIYKTLPYIYHTLPSQEDVYALWKGNFELTRCEASTTIDFSSLIRPAKSRRAQANRAKREGVILSESTDFDAFIQLENAVLQEYHQTTAVHTAAELRLLQSRFPQNIRLFLAQKNGNLLAGTLIFEYPQLVHTQYMASSAEGRHIGALDLLIISLLDKYASSKKYFDFGISTEQGGTLFNEGLCAQKEGFGGRTTVYQTWQISV